jgi:hypothetical protein
VGEQVGHGKGSLLIHTRDYILRTRGRTVWDELLESSSAEDREVLGGIYLAGGWYPIGVVNRIVAAYCENHHAQSPDDEMKRLSAYIADTDLGGVYKMVLRLGSPDFLVKRTPSLWNRYFDVGDLTPSQVGSREWRLRLVMPLEDERAPNRFFCGPGCPAWIEMGLKLTGAERARVEHVECRFENREACVYRVTW